MITVCVDACGGDFGAAPVLEGVEQTLANHDDISVLLAGPQEIVEPFCETHNKCAPLIAPSVIEMDEHPLSAVRKKKDSSIVLGCKAVAAQEADAFFSAGSTGAIYMAASLYVKELKGVKRAGLAVVLPSSGSRHTILCDLGANADARPQSIVQFAQMASVVSQVQGLSDEPEVALLSNGSEDSKGSELSKAYFKALKQAENAGLLLFAGNAEGTDLLAGRYDVVVTDGFTGNIALKSMEGIATYIAHTLKARAKKSFAAALGALLIKSTFKDIAYELSGDAYGGAMLLGLRSPIFIGHGHTSALAVQNGILAAAGAAQDRLCERIATQIEQDTPSSLNTE